VHTDRWKIHKVEVNYRSPEANSICQDFEVSESVTYSWTKVDNCFFLKSGKFPSLIPHFLTKAPFSRRATNESEITSHGILSILIFLSVVTIAILSKFLDQIVVAVYCALIPYPQGYHQQRQKIQNLQEFSFSLSDLDRQVLFFYYPMEPWRHYLLLHPV